MECSEHAPHPFEDKTAGLESHQENFLRVISLKDICSSDELIKEINDVR